MVRLKGTDTKSFINFCNRFQFQDGAIKGRFKPFLIAIKSPFQFQDGAIKGFGKQGEVIAKYDFNSKMVRLKGKLRFLR